ncbi:hypothetical protein ABEF95_002200 [Exophiala dermatitidis]
MSVEASKPVEDAPVAETPKVLPEQPSEASTAPAETSVHDETTVSAPAEAAATEQPATQATEEVKKEETAAAATPISEGVLGYKEPTLFKKFFFTKHYFWLSDEPLTSESLATFLRSEKPEGKHSTAAWARETGKGLLFFAKRVEDKASPVGIINLADASNVIKDGYDQFSFKAGGHQHRFEASKPTERDGWVVAIEKAIEGAKGLKEEITGRESYKKNVEEYSKPPTFAPAAVKAPRSKSKEPKKSLDATTATAAATTAAPAADNASASSSSDEAAKAQKERSQSRKRGSIFGNLRGKKDELVEKKEEKAEAKKEVKEEKKAESEDKKEEAKAGEEPTTVTAGEPAEAAAVAVTAATVPATAGTADKKENQEEATATTDRKAKRGSVFGNLFKHRVTSPTTEKTEKEATTASDVPPVSETAPKLDEPIDTKPINTADVTAPVDAETSAAPAVEEPAKDATPAATETATTPKTEKKGGFMGFIKKTEAKLEGKKEHKEEHKEETKEDKAAEAIAQDPVAAASTDAAPESAVVDAPTETKEERPARDNKRRTSLFFNKKRTENNENTEEATNDHKREKSPIPGKLFGNLVRRASKAVKSEEPKDKPASATADAEPAAETATTETSAHQATTISETPAPAATTSEPTEATESTQIKGDVVPEDFVAKPESATAAAPEVKATA